MPRGLEKAREAVVSYYRERGLRTDPAQLHLTASSSEGYSWLFKLLANQGEAILVPQPSYPLFDFLATLEGVRLIPYQLRYYHHLGWRIDFESIADAITSDVQALPPIVSSLDILPAALPAAWGGDFTTALAISVRRARLSFS